MSKEIDKLIENDKKMHELLDENNELVDRVENFRKAGIKLDYAKRLIFDIYELKEGGYTLQESKSKRYKKKSKSQQSRKNNLMR